MKTKGAYDFATKDAQYKGYTDEALRYAAHDVRETLRFWKNHPNEGWYLDDLHTVAKVANSRGMKGLL